MRRIPNRVALATELPRGGIGAELGTHQGNYAAVLWKHAAPATLHLVDNFSVTIGGVTGQAAEASVRSRFAAELASGSIRLHLQHTVDWLAAQPASSLDWSYHDSEHSDHHVFRELCQALRVVKAGGWICGHDYAASTPGVVSAVDRFCWLHGLRIAILTDEPPMPIVWRDQVPWQPAECPFNSFAIRVEK